METTRASKQEEIPDIKNISIESLIKNKLEALFEQQRDLNVELDGLYDIVIEQVERPLIELTLKQFNGNQLKTAQMLGINRNTLKKKIDSYKINARSRKKPAGL